MKIHVVEYKRLPEEVRFRAVAYIPSMGSLHVLGQGSTPENAVKDLFVKIVNSLMKAEIDIDYDTTKL